MFLMLVLIRSIVDEVNKSGSFKTLKKAVIPKRRLFYTAIKSL